MMGISNVSWNSQVQHIIAACATNGYTVVWDLRTKREILSLYAPESSISSIAWHPNMVHYTPYVFHLFDSYIINRAHKL